VFTDHDAGELDVRPRDGWHDRHLGAQITPYWTIAVHMTSISLLTRTAGIRAADVGVTARAGYVG
jgi:hypothetical protein